MYTKEVRRNDMRPAAFATSNPNEGGRGLAAAS